MDGLRTRMVDRRRRGAARRTRGLIPARTARRWLLGNGTPPGIKRGAAEASAARAFYLSARRGARAYTVKAISLGFSTVTPGSIKTAVMSMPSLS